VGIAMAGGAASSVLVADGIVAAAAVGPLLAGIRAARLSNKAVQSNLRRSLIYNLLAIAAASAGLVNPLVAALLMPLSSGMVIWGASRIEHQMQRFSKDDA
jgi:Cu2+-exporting ATPase